MRDFLEAVLRGSVAFQEAGRLIEEARGPVRISGSAESQKVHIMMKAGGERTRLIVTYDEQAALGILEDARLFSSDVYYFPAKDLLFYQADARSNTLVRQRMRAIRMLTEEAQCTVVTTVQALMNALLPPAVFREKILRLKEADVIEVSDLAERLTELGYERTASVEEPGEFAIHGGIADVYDLTAENPIRIEFFDNEIDTIREFNPASQLSVRRVGEAVIYPASELILDRDGIEEGLLRLKEDYGKNLETLKKREAYEAGAALQSLFKELEDALRRMDLNGLPESFLPYFYPKTSFLEDYLPAGTAVMLEEPLRMKEFSHLTETEFVESFKLRLEKGMTLPKAAGVMRDSARTFAALETGRTALFTALDSGVTFMKVRASFRIDGQPVVSYFGNIESLVKDLLRFERLKFSVVLLVQSRTRGKRIAEELREHKVHAYYSEDREGIEAVPGQTLVTYGALRKGYECPLQKFVIFTENDLYSVREKKKQKKKAQTSGDKLRSYQDLKAGDYVVHESYGIGIYRGVVKLDSGGVGRDYMQISYGTSGTLYVPVTNLDVVQKYASADSKPPKISRLDSPEWSHTKKRVRTAVKEVAEELVRLYYTRQHTTGFEYGPDTTWQREFEESFPYEETEDQLRAIDDVKRDMESTKIMDRLICGDVGFGKTEIALRAAFKAVQDGKQVAYLVPTTILAEQHYHTFSERMQNYPVTVAMLSRFTPEKRVKEIIADLKRGMVDVVIGTHKILSKSVEFKDLGLLIIDEEQRFGVAHKEKIKELKTNVDVLTLTATPIPRTLHMSMIGVRDMSLLTEPPEERRAIQTYVMEYSEELVREAIERELTRHGQVFYVYNRAADIADVAAKLQELVPEANITYVHGKMNEREIESRMVSFISGQTDVLVSTTIIETGLDIPNVNTIIVHDSERYGLAQLYQLRGRVGRSSRQAYAFIMYRKDRIPTEEAEKRLEAIRQFTELGSGIKIAMQDLEIRGAGTVLGNAQSGHMAQVGYDLYCKMLSEAVHRAKNNETDEEPFETLLDIRVDAFIPPSYIENEALKLEVYKKISLLQTEEDREALADELIDRYGDIPVQVENLMEVALLRVTAKQLYFSEIKGNTAEISFRFVPFAKIRGENVTKLIEEMKGAMRYLPSDPPGLCWRERNLRNIGKTPILTLLKALLDDIKRLLIE